LLQRCDVAAAVAQKTASQCFVNKVVDGVVSSMKVSDYDFGRIAVEGSSYTADVIITPERVIDHWWRKQGHSLAIEDLDAVVQADPDVLVVGTGYYGRMQIPDETRNYLAEKGIRLIDANTRDAVGEFNALQKEYARIVAALHLTC